MADDLVAAYEAAALDCCGAPPQRECCVRAGVAAYVRAMRDRVTAAITAAYTQRVRDRVNASPNDHARAFADAAIEALVGAWPGLASDTRVPAVDRPAETCGDRAWAGPDPGCFRRAGHTGGHGYADGSGEQDGWGAMLRHGTGEAPSRTTQLVDAERMGFAVDWSLERRCVCVETTNFVELEAGRRTWTPGCDQHPALDTSAIYDGHYPDQEAGP